MNYIQHDIIQNDGGKQQQAWSSEEENIIS